MSGLEGVCGELNKVWRELQLSLDSMIFWFKSLVPEGFKIRRVARLDYLLLPFIMFLRLFSWFVLVIISSTPANRRM